MDSKTVLVSRDDLIALCVRAFRGVGVPRRDAEVVADSLVDANLRGIDSHGVVRVPKYLKGLHRGTINAQPKIRISRAAKAALDVDGDNGLGAVVAFKAVKELIRVCKSTGVAAAGVRRSNHFGTITYYLLQAAKAGFIGAGFTHGESLQVPFGGQTPFFGTNPLAFAFPTRTSPPIVVDFATSATTFGKIMQAKLGGSLLPEGMVLDSGGAMTREPEKAARILPAAGHKGYGLAVAVEILSGILNGCPFGPHVPPVFRDDIDHPGNLGHFFMTVDPDRFFGRETFLDQIERLIQELHEITPAGGFDAVLVPGEPEARTYAQRLREGIPLDPSLLEKIKQFDCRVQS